VTGQLHASALLTPTNRNNKSNSEFIILIKLSVSRN